jgi:hypothetical protein
LAGFQKTDFGVSSAFGAGNTKIGFIMRIADLIETQFLMAQLRRAIKNWVFILRRSPNYF